MRSHVPNQTEALKESHVSGDELSWHISLTVKYGTELEKGSPH